MKRRRGTVLVLLLVALLMVAGSQMQLLAHPLEEDPGRRLLYLPNGKFMKVASMGYPTFVADMIYLWSIQFYGSYDEREERFQYLDHVFRDVIPGLDARFVDPYLVGALIMVIEKNDVEGALSLLDQGIAANPDDWLMPYEAGFWAYDTARDFARAEKYFRLAMEIPGAPPSTRRLHAEMINKRGDKVTSLALWQEILTGSSEDRVLAVAANHVHDLTIEVDLMHLAAAAERFKARHGRPPGTPDELVAGEFLAALPMAPDGKPYVFNPDTGVPESTSPFRLRRR
jgi:tetratricopeptide (TPR) repeat protein